MDLSWNPYSCGGLFMSAPRLVEKIRSRQCPVTAQFLRALSLCHTVMAEWKNGCGLVFTISFKLFLLCIIHISFTQWLRVYILCTGDFTLPEAPVYQAASPDEEALVSATRELGWVFLSRTRDSVVVSELGVTRQYQLLALLEFTSQRRRMSVLGQIRFSDSPK